MSPRKLCLLISFDISRYFKFPFVQAETVILAGHAQSIAPCYPHWWMVKVTFGHGHHVTM
jgi:hypothetical protein